MNGYPLRDAMILCAVRTQSIRISAFIKSQAGQSLRQSVQDLSAFEKEQPRMYFLKYKNNKIGFYCTNHMISNQQGNAKEFK